MASTFSNLFDLLAGDESNDDVTDLHLYERMEKKADEEVPSSPPKTRKEYTILAENSEHTDSKEEAHGNGNKNENGSKSDEEGWQVVSKKVNVKKVQENGNEHANGDGTEQTKGNGKVNGERPMTNGNVNGNGNGRGGKRRSGSVRYGNGDNGEVKNLSNGGNGDGVDAGNSNVNSEGDAAVTVESSNDKEIEEKETTEELKSDVPEPEETAEERKERVRKEQIRKEREEREERRRLRRQEAAEEAKKMTLDQYEQTLLKKQQALNLQKAEARRVVPGDEDFENMKQIWKKKDNDETLIVEKEKLKGKAALVKSTSESTLKKSESLEKGPKPLAVGLAKLFRPASFRGDRSGRAVSFPSQNGSSSDGSQRNNNGPPPAAETLTDQLQFPVLGSVPPELPSEPSAPAANPSTSSGPNSSESSAPPANPSTLSGPNSSDPSAPPANPSTSSGPNSSEPSSRPSFSKGNRSGYKNNRSHTGNRPTTTAANSASATRSATAANSSVRAER